MQFKIIFAENVLPTFLGSARLFWGRKAFFYAPKKPKKSPDEEKKANWHVPLDRRPGLVAVLIRVAGRPGCNRFASKATQIGV